MALSVSKPAHRPSLHALGSGRAFDRLSVPTIGHLLAKGFPVVAFDNLVKNKELYIRLQLLKRVDNAIYRINHYPVDSVFILPIFIYWTAMYTLDSAIQPLNNWGHCGIETQACCIKHERD